MSPYRGNQLTRFCSLIRDPSCLEPLSTPPWALIYDSLWLHSLRVLKLIGVGGDREAWFIITRVTAVFISHLTFFLFLLFPLPLRIANMSLEKETQDYHEKDAQHSSAVAPGTLGVHTSDGKLGSDPEDRGLGAPEQNALHRDLKGRHMQMIAMWVRDQVLKCILIRAVSGGAIGAGLFIGSGSAFTSGGPGSVLIGFLAIGQSYSTITMVR